MKFRQVAALGIGMIFLMGASQEGCNSADDQDRRQQEGMLEQARSQAGLPSITHFQEKKNLKMIMELRDQEALQTWTYLVAEQTGQLVLLGRSMGYGIPAATQYTNPMKHSGYGSYALPQADPNGLFSPTSAEGTWVMLLDGEGQPHPTYVEPRIIVSTFPLK